MKTYEIIGKHVPYQFLQCCFNGLSKWIVYLIFHSVSFVFPDEPLDLMNIEKGRVYKLTHVYFLFFFCRDTFFFQKCFINPSNLHQMVILIPYNKRGFILAQSSGLPDLINDGIGKGDTAACVLNKIIFYEMRPWKNW